MSKAAPRFAQVFVYHPHTHKYDHVGVDIDREKLTAFSLLARRRLASGGSHDYNLPAGGRHSIVIDGRDADIPSAKAICRWIQNNDTKDPKPLTRHYAASETFPDLVKLYTTSYRLFITRESRGFNIHTDLLWYIKAGALRADEFAMLVECCSFDDSLITAAKHDIMFRSLKGGVKLCPELAQIKEWAVSVGLWEEMLGIERHIMRKFGLSADQCLAFGN